MRFFACLRPKQAMQRFARLQRPVYITETGIADRKDHLRAEWAEAYFKAVRIHAACRMAMIQDFDLNMLQPTRLCTHCTLLLWSSVAHAGAVLRDLC